MDETMLGTAAPDAGSGVPRDAPSLSLPTAGGAIRGMGEKFATNPVTGTASMSVPVTLTPARDGATPALALAYDSGAGNSPFGLGWSLGVASVSRRTDKGLPRYVDDGPDADVFQLTGAEDLVPAVSAPSAPGAVAYRPRTEGLFSRIERVPDPATGATSWLVTSKDNVRQVFGRTPAGRIADPADPGRVFSWLLEETADERGNLVRYEYKAEGSNAYLKRVRYGNRTTDGDFCFEVVLDYGDHDLATPTPAESDPWAERPDPFSTRRPGFEVRTSRLCRRILMFHDIPELDAAPVLTASTGLTHDLDPASAKLLSIVHNGYIGSASRGYVSKPLPPVTFTYVPRVVSSAEGVLTAAHGEAPARADGGYRWTDLDGDGIAGLLGEQAGTWYYRPNLGSGTVGPPRLVDPLPAGTSLGRGSRLLDVAGEGRQAVTRLDGAVPGYHRRTADRGWADFTPFPRLPNLAWDDPNLRFVDLTGDGLADVLLTDSDGLTWHPSAGLAGFTDSLRLAAASTEERGPRVVFADAEQGVYLADMTGDGLTDLVRVRNGEVVYWPNLGYGRFGAKAAMAGAPVFDRPDRFDQRRVHLSDVDGSAPADLLYQGPNGVTVWFNQAGNSFGAAETVEHTAGAATLQVSDLLGTGTACLVLSDQRPDQEPQVRYVDLMAAGRPHLLSSVDNGMGLTTTIGYASSTESALADDAAGTPWVTRLPFPVHVVTEVTVTDAVADTTLVTGYRYRHGYYDGVEREFRGFAYVEQRDALSFQGPADRITQPPAVVKRWQHTGWYPDADRITHQFTGDYWQHGAGPLLPDTIVPSGLSTEEEREAVRALRGHPLREEVFSEDETGQLGDPYTVTESNYRLRVLQPQGDRPYAVVFAYPGETVTVHTERHPDDPRTGHSATLDVDDWGNVLRSAAIAYPRLVAADPEQARLHVVVTEHDVVNDIGSTGHWRTGVAIETRAYEVGGLHWSGSLFDIEEVAAWYAGAADIPFQDTADGTTAQRRLISRTRQTYYSADQTAELPLGQVSTPVLPYLGYRQAFGPGQVPLLYGGRVSDSMLSAAGYVQADGVWWLPSGRQVFDPVQFYLATSSIDPFGSTWQLGYDRYLLRAVRVGDPVGNVSQAALNYRVLRPWLFTDPNGNRTGVRFDPLGLVVATALMGKGEGDTLDMSTVESSTADRPTSWLAYDLTARPTRFTTFARERHAAADSPVQESHTYCDGTGRTILVKVQAEPASGQTTPRWVGTGRTIHDNKGNPVKKYEPYFATDSEFDTEPALVLRGVTTILRYDPLGRLVGTDFPDGTLARVVFDAWDQEDWDRNDTVRESAWYAARSVLPPEDPRRQAADAAAKHTGTPGRSFFDTLGRAHVVRADNGTENLDTTVDRDVQGNELLVTDPRGIPARRQDHDMLGRAAYAVSPDSGERWSLTDATGKPAYAWDGRGTAMRWIHDRLRRPTHSYATPAGGTELLRTRTYYGESADSATTHNLRTRPYAVFDGAGVQRTVDVDFKGNTLTTERRLAADALSEPDWTPLAAVDGPSAALVAVESDLDTDTHRTSTAYDALNRPTLVTGPDGSSTRPAYNAANLLEAVDAQLRGAADWTSFVVNVDYNERGQRVFVESGCGARTVYTYEPDTFRLSSAESRDAGNSVLQSLRYTYDPVGNLVVAADPAQDTVFYRNTAVAATRTYSYEPSYRLSTATGREHPGQTGQPVPADLPYGDLPHANDSTALRPYTESYSYDGSGNLTQLKHTAAGGDWTRRHAIAHDSNRLVASSIPGDAAGVFSAVYRYDAAGNTTGMPHLSTLDWNVDDRPAHAGLGGGGDAYYQYDASGERVRATVVQGGTTETRGYFGSSEVYVKTVAGTTRVRRETLHVDDGTNRIALVETTTADGGTPVANPVPVPRFPLDDHLGSVTLELDDHSAVLTYEEYHPFGTTSFHAPDRTDLSRKRYRFTGKERDDETGFYYHGARYYAPWLARWTSPDPVGLVDGPGPYTYVRDNPVRFLDPDGLAAVAGSQDTDAADHRFTAAVQQRVADTMLQGLRAGERPPPLTLPAKPLTAPILGGPVASPPLPAPSNHLPDPSPPPPSRPVPLLKSPDPATPKQAASASRDNGDPASWRVTGQTGQTAATKGAGLGDLTKVPLIGNFTTQAVDGVVENLVKPGLREVSDAGKNEGALPLKLGFGIGIGGLILAGIATNLAVDSTIPLVDVKTRLSLAESAGGALFSFGADKLADLTKLKSLDSTLKFTFETNLLELLAPKQPPAQPNPAAALTATIPGNPVPPAASTNIPPIQGSFGKLNAQINF